MKKIALYIPSMNGGGAERVMLTLANSLVEKGLNVDLVLNNAQGPYIKDVSSKVNIVELKTSRAITSLIPLARYLRKDKPDTILSAMNYINIITVFARELSFTNTRVVISEHDNLSMSMKSQKRPIFNFAFKKLMSYSYRKSDAIVAVSNGVADDLAKQMRISRSKITTIYNPIVTSKLIETIKSPSSLSHQWLGKKNTPVIIAAGRLTKQKAFDTLIYAFSKVCNELDCRLIILGEGDLESYLKEIIIKLNLEKKIDLVGFVNNPYAWISQSDLFVLSSIHEGFGNVIVEAMACATPVISTDCPSGPSEILDGGKWGTLVPVGDIDSLSKAIIDAITIPSHISPKDLQQRASVFSGDNAVDSYLAILTN